MKILHTSDWHLGGQLHGQKRYEEHEKFLDWLIERIREENIDILLIAGDIFDSSTPSNHAQMLYYRFLNHVAGIPYLQVVITAGNHDSPSLLNAPKDLLRQLRIHVIGLIPSDISEEVLVLQTEDGSQSQIVCAVPYLRDRDIRMAEPGESIEDKARKIQEGICDHYRQVAEIAESVRRESGVNMPIIAMGHLFVEGCLPIPDEGVRELYIGNLAGIDAERIARGFDYLALGHLHTPRIVGNNPCRRYSGSPIPMGFGEAGQEKEIVIIETRGGREVSPHAIRVPCFRQMKKIKGDIATIEEQLQDCIGSGQEMWVEIHCTTELNASSSQVRFREMVENTQVKILKFLNEPLMERALQGMDEGENLGDLDETEVFSRCLDAHEIPDAERGDLLILYREILTAIGEEDRYAE